MCNINHVNQLSNKNIDHKTAFCSKSDLKKGNPFFNLVVKLLQQRFHTEGGL